MEQSLAIRRGNPRSAVDDLHANDAVVALSAGNHGRAGWGMQKCVFKKICDYLVDLRVVASDGRELLRDVDLDLTTCQS